MKFVEMGPDQLPLALLLEADPAEQRIAAYLPGAWGFAALAGNEVVGACVAGLVWEQTAEIFNIAVAPNRQQQGIGSGLLRFVLTSLAGKGVCRVELGTGSFGHQPPAHLLPAPRLSRRCRREGSLPYPLSGAPDGARHPAQGYG